MAGNGRNTRSGGAPTLRRPAGAGAGAFDARITAPVPTGAHSPARHADFLSRVPLFKGVAPADIAALLECLDARERRYREGDYIYRMGDTVNAMGLVITGAVRIETVDAWGTTSVIGFKDAGKAFAESYAALPHTPLMVGVVAARDSDILFVNVSKLHQSCSQACGFHGQVQANLMRILARNNLMLSRRIMHVAPKTIRGKALAYLSSQATAAGTNEFDIPFNRQQLADYLGVDRSALSAELSKMQKEGILTTQRSHFVLNDTVL